MLCVIREAGGTPGWPVGGLSRKVVAHHGADVNDLRRTGAGGRRWMEASLGGIAIRDLGEDHAFGSIVTGVTFDALRDEAVRGELNALFDRRGLIVFEGVERSNEMQVALSEVFGPLKGHPSPNVALVDGRAVPGLVDMHYHPDAGNRDVVEIDGRVQACWSPWHFDHCYTDKLNRGGVLRALVIAPEGGLTGFADGIEMYEALSDETKRRIEDMSVVYTIDTRPSRIRFGLPDRFRALIEGSGHDPFVEEALRAPRAVHPMVWTRATGEKVFHVSPWMAAGIVGQEDADGDALLEQVWREAMARIRPYHHRWKPDDMLIWDNWRMLHEVDGVDPKVERRMQRTTIEGDYGFGSFERRPQGLEVTLERA